MYGDIAQINMNTLFVGHEASMFLEIRAYWRTHCAVNSTDVLAYRRGEQLYCQMRRRRRRFHRRQQHRRERQPLVENSSWLPRESRWICNTMFRKLFRASCTQACTHTTELRVTWHFVVGQRSRAYMTHSSCNLSQFWRSSRELLISRSH